jgi:hypothetical protein
MNIASIPHGEQTVSMRPWLSPLCRKVWIATRDIDESSGRRLDQSLTDLERVLALQHVKSFIEQVLVEQRSTRIASRSEALVNGQRTLSVFDAYFKSCRDRRVGD